MENKTLTVTSDSTTPLLTIKNSTSRKETEDSLKKFFDVNKEVTGLKGDLNVSESTIVKINASLVKVQTYQEMCLVFLENQSDEAESVYKSKLKKIDEQKVAGTLTQTESDRAACQILHEYDAVYEQCHELYWEMLNRK